MHGFRRITPSKWRRLLPQNGGRYQPSATLQFSSSHSAPSVTFFAIRGQQDFFAPQRALFDIILNRGPANTTLIAQFTALTKKINELSALRHQVERMTVSLQGISHDLIKQRIATFETQRDEILSVIDEITLGITAVRAEIINEIKLELNFKIDFMTLDHTEISIGILSDALSSVRSEIAILANVIPNESQQLSTNLNQKISSLVHSEVLRYKTDPSQADRLQVLTWINAHDNLRPFLAQDLGLPGTATEGEVTTELQRLRDLHQARIQQGIAHQALSRRVSFPSTFAHVPQLTWTTPVVTVQTTPDLEPILPLHLDLVVPLPNVFPYAPYAFGPLAHVELHDQPTHVEMPGHEYHDQWAIVPWQSHVELAPVETAAMKKARGFVQAFLNKKEDLSLKSQCVAVAQSDTLRPVVAEVLDLPKTASADAIEAELERLHQSAVPLVVTIVQGKSQAFAASHGRAEWPDGE